MIFDTRDDADEALATDLAIVEVLGHHGGSVGLPVLVDVEAVDLLDVTVDGVGNVGGLVADLALEETPVVTRQNKRYKLACFTTTNNYLFQYTNILAFKILNKI
jgi:hypothetical protein